MRLLKRSETLPLTQSPLHQENQKCKPTRFVMIFSVVFAAPVHAMLMEIRFLIGHSRVRVTLKDFSLAIRRAVEVLAQRRTSTVTKSAQWGYESGLRCARLVAFSYVTLTFITNSRCYWFIENCTPCHAFTPIFSESRDWELPLAS